MGSLLYRVESGKLVSYEAGQCRVDGHVHSRNPRLDVPNRTTTFLGVKESYTSPKKAHRVMKRRGMDLYTLSNHDCVEDALELRRMHPERSFINCEYTVAVEPESSQVIHVGCWGLDYAGGVSSPLSDSVVRELHDEIMSRRRLGYAKFTGFCKEAGIAHVFNHPPWQGTPRNPISGSQFEEVIDAFDILEINGDMQLENLFTLELALAKEKVLCAGTDAHTSRRIGNQFTSSLYRADTPAEFLEAFRKGDICIGSRFRVPDDIATPSLYDIVLHSFNGSVSELQKDTFEGVWDYFMREWGGRKMATVGVASAASMGLSAGIGAIAGPEYGLIPFGIVTALQALALIAIPWVIPRKEKHENARRTAALYRDYHEMLLERETREPKERIAFHEEEIRKHRAEIERYAKLVSASEDVHSRKLPNMIADPRRFEWLAFRYLRSIAAFGSDYDLGARLVRKKP